MIVVIYIKVQGLTYFVQSYGNVLRVHQEEQPFSSPALTPDLQTPLYSPESKMENRSGARSTGPSGHS